MRLVIDTNQADRIRLSYKSLPRQCRPTLVIPPLVWAELVLGGGNDKRRRALAKFDLRFGMDMAKIFDELAQKNEEQIRQFIPIRNDAREIHQRLLFNFEYPAPEHRRIAQQIRENAIQQRDTIGPYLQQIRKRNRDAIALANQRGEPGPEFAKWASIAEAEPILFMNSEAPFRSWFVREIATDYDGNQRPIRCQSEQSLFDAVWDNLMFRRFLRVIAIVNFGYAQGVWGDPQLNMQFAPGRNDDTDFSLMLYACDGDVVLTQDRIKHALKHADTADRISIQSWQEWMEAKLREDAGGIP